MIDIVQWRASIGSWNGCSLSSKLKYSHSAKYVSNSTMLFVVLLNCHFLLYFLAEVTMILLILAGDVETNPGPLTGTHTCIFHVCKLNTMYVICILYMYISFDV